MLEKLENVSGSHDDLEKLMEVMWGESSELFHIFKQIIKQAIFEDFAQWFGAFLFSCSLNMNYSSCYDRPNISTGEFCDAKQYNAFWNRIDKFGEGNSDSK